MAEQNNLSVDHWHKDVPGARWFRGDFHIHTLDDHLGNATWVPTEPIENSNDPTNATIRATYVRAFLRAAITAKIEVIGLTPHSAHIPQDASTSVVWDIVTAWQTDADDDGIPFRSKIYAIFPGFEPSFADGSSGVHLIVLFDPQVGKDRYLKAFSLVTGGQNVWQKGTHHISTINIQEAFKKLVDLKQRDGEGWDFLCIAPHAFSSKGLIKSLKGELGANFPHGAIAACELKHGDLPIDAFQVHPYLADHLNRYNQSLIHCSDAYCLSNQSDASKVDVVNTADKRGIGYRFTFVKLALPRIESLRQAFLCRDSRVQIAYQKTQEGKLALCDLSPEPYDTNRPWLRSVKIAEGTSFFGGLNKEQTLWFSPDMTCIIGGRMTGKSTLLDGIRRHCQLDLPTDDALSADVVSRAKTFLSGNPDIAIDLCGPVATTKPYCERWPAKFFTQRELKSIASDRANVRNIVFHLVSHGPDLLKRFTSDLASHDAELKGLVEKISAAKDTQLEKEQALKAAQDAKAALDQFRDAGSDELTKAQADQGRQQAFRMSLEELNPSIDRLTNRFEEISAPKIELTDTTNTTPKTDAVTKNIESIKDHLRDISSLKQESDRITGEIVEQLDSHVEDIRTKVQRSLVDAGRKAEDLNEFDALAAIAADYEFAAEEHNAAKAATDKLEKKFEEIEAQRTVFLQKLRDELRDITQAVNEDIDAVRVSLVVGSDRSVLDEWIKSFRDGAITRWWNDQPALSNPAKLLECFKLDSLNTLNMTPAVVTRFNELMTSKNIYTLRALRSEDECKIEALEEDTGNYKPIEKLSGGKQISVVLSLLLESSDTSPLIIDQPEDELDKAFLTETLLPILRRLKGRRQVIFATHDANIVVNGDADQVIHLDATSEAATVQAQGAIDEPKIRKAILHVLDGGQDAFDLRKKKYGF